MSNLLKATIGTRSKKVSIRRCPWDPLVDEEVTKEFKPGDLLEVKIDSPVFDWQDHLFYEAFQYGQPLGYVRADALIIESKGGAPNGKRVRRKYSSNSIPNG